jgi:hypothetical protein
MFVKVALDGSGRNMACCPHIVTPRPQIRQTAFEVRKFFAQFVCRVPLEPVHDLVGSYRGRKATKEMNVIRPDHEVQHFAAKFGTLFSNQFVKARSKTIYQDSAPEFWYPNEVVVDVVCAVAYSFTLHERIVPHLLNLCKLLGIQEIGAIPRPG